MKKILSILMFICAFSFVMPNEVKAQVYTYKTTAYAYQQTNSYGNWGQWSEWMDSDMTMVINFNTDVVTIYSPTTQRYKITKHIENYTDSSGGKNVKFAAIDEEGLTCNVRLRIETNGNSQIYITWSNLNIVYNVRRTN